METIKVTSLYVKIKILKRINRIKVICHLSVYLSIFIAIFVYLALSTTYCVRVRVCVLS